MERDPLKRALLLVARLGCAEPPADGKVATPVDRVPIDEGAQAIHDWVVSRVYLRWRCQDAPPPVQPRPEDHAKNP